MDLPWTAPLAATVAKPHDITQSLLYLDGVSVSFDGFRAINDLSLELAPGEMRAIIGPNGAGKTTMMDVITGKTRPDSGDVLFDQRQHRPHHQGRGRHRPARHRPQVPEADRVRQPHGGGQRPARAEGRPHGATQPVLARPTATPSASARSLDTIGLAAHRHRLAGSLSHGQKQWLEIGMLIAQDPKLLLVDEPVAGMTDAEIHDHGRAAEGHRQGPHGDRGRARHGVRAPARRQGHGAARRLGAGRRHASTR